MPNEEVICFRGTEGTPVNSSLFTCLHVDEICVASVQLDIVHVPLGEGVGVRLQVAQDPGVSAAGEVPVVLVDAELQTQALDLNWKTKDTKLYPMLQTEFSPILEPQDQDIGEFCLV